MNKAKGVISEIVPGSIAEELGIEKGDKLIEINGEKPEDLIDINYLFADEFLELVIEKPSGEEWILEVEKEYNEEIGISFENSTFDGIKSCHNKCIFCFVDQMPPGMRNSLYIKDDDYRMSFMHGNFVTFTNLNSENVDRILTMRLSPLYISVHTTNSDLRRKMLNNKKAGDIVALLNRLAEAKIDMHTQVVLCPDFNDEEELDKTIRDLSHLWPQVQSIAIVPVGLTKFRDNLVGLRGFTKVEASRVIEQVVSFQEKFLAKYEYPLVFLADEFYLIAEKDIPKAESYADFPQLENGVGLARLFLDSFEENKTMLPSSLTSNKKVIMVTGVSGGKVIREVINELEKIGNLDIKIKVIANQFFGETVTVTGLVTGQDIVNQLLPIINKEEIFIPSVMLKADEDIFLDGMTVLDLEKKLGTKIKIVDLNEGAKGLIEELSNDSGSKM